MMDTPLTTELLFRGAIRTHRQTEVVSRLSSGELHRYTFAEFGERTQQLSNALDGLGLPLGSRIATLAWNGYRHLEAYYAVPNSGRVLHTLNLRLSADELVFIMTDAADDAVLVDADLVPILKRVLPRVSSLQHVIVMGDAKVASDHGWLDYEELIADEPTTHDAPDLAETDPCGLCYTSGTTGRPKGVTYTHRSTFLHALAVTSHAGMSVGPSDCVLPLVPMFHANAWGVPYAAVAVGAKICLYGGALNPESFVDLVHAEGVTVSAGVPSIWIEVADELAKRGRPARLRHLISGGSQPPRSLIERYNDELGIPMVQAWGMTETSPLGSVAWPHHHLYHLPQDQLIQAVGGQAGLPVPGVEVSIRDESGLELPADGASMGDLYVRGPWVIDGYLHGAGAEQFSPDGWFQTGDVAIGSRDGYFVIADRTKDLIKSGGEWISSVDMEASIMALPGVIEAAVIAVPDPKWVERPMACIVAGPDAALTKEDVLVHLESAGFPRWQLPDRVQFIGEVPKTAVGKFDKKVLRAEFGNG
jgi:fatty-acyl-CoA synthase